MATKANIVIDQGTTFSVTLDLTDENGDVINLNNSTATAQMRKWYTSSNSVTFNTFIDTAAGTISLELDADTTSLIEAGRYVYDVELTNTVTNTISRIVEGIVTVTPQVTR